MALVDAADPAQALHRVLVAEVAAERVAGVGRIGDHAARAHDLRRPRDQARRCGCVGMDVEVLGQGRPRTTARQAATPVVPDRLEVRRQRRQPAEVDVALLRPVEVRAPRGEQIELAREARELDVLVGRVAAGHDLDALAARRLELVEELPELRRARACSGPGCATTARPPLARIHATASASSAHCVRHVARLARAPGSAGTRSSRRAPRRVSTRKRAKCARPTSFGFSA